MVNHLDIFPFSDAKSFLDQTEDDKALPFLLDVQIFMDDEDWLRLLGIIWPRINNANACATQLLTTPLGAHLGKGPVPQMMSKETWEVYEALPMKVAIYAGCAEIDQCGILWWTQAQQVKPGDREIVVKAMADKSDILSVAKAQSSVARCRAAESARSVLPLGCRHR